jgi:hypothetical protein
MARRERELEHAVHTVAKRAAKTDDLVVDSKELPSRQSP